MPSSGSTTSLSASVTSSTLAGVLPGWAAWAAAAASRSTSGSSIFSSVWSGILHSFVGCEGLRRGIAPRRPAQQRAFDTGRELRDAGERDTVLQYLFVRLDIPPALHQLEELLVRRHALGHRLADHQVRHHRRRRLADRAAHAAVRDALDGLAVELDPERDLVPAGRVHVVHLHVVRVREARVVRAAVVIQDDLLVEAVELHYQSTLKNDRTNPSPSTSASISSGVVYR